MPKTLLPVVLLGLGMATATHGEAPPAPRPAAKAPAAKAPAANADPAVERLIRQLGDSDFRKRDQALDQLRARGVAVVPALRKALGSPDAEVRRRVLELIPALETEAVLAPKRVTLRADKKRLADIFDEISKQTGYKITFWSSNPNQTASVNFRNRPFWEVIDHLCLEAGLVVQQGYGDEQVRLQQQNGHSPYFSHSGSFRFVANSFQQVRNVDFSVVGNGAGINRNENLTFSFTIFSEPRMPLLGVDQPKLTAAYDSEKNSMLMPAEGNNPYINGPWGFGGMRSTSRYGNGNRTFSQQTSVNLHRVSEKATKIRLLRGVVPVTLLVEQKPVAVSDNILKAKGKKVKIGTTQFYIEDVKEIPANKQFQLKVSITEQNKDLANVNDYSWVNSLYQRLELVDAKGNKYQSFGNSWGNMSPNHVQMTFTYGNWGGAKLGPPTRFIFHQWTTMQQQIPFEFKDLPLP